MSAPEHSGPSSSRIVTGEQKTTEEGRPTGEIATTSADSQPKQWAKANRAKQGSKAGTSGKSHNIKRRQHKPKVPNAVAQAAKYARNPGQDYRQKQQECTQRNEKVRQQASQFRAKSTPFRVKPPARSNERIIQFNRRPDPIIAQDQAKRRADHQDHTINELKKQVYLLQQQIQLTELHSAAANRVPISVSDIPLPDSSNLSVPSPIGDNFLVDKSNVEPEIGPKPDATNNSNRSTESNSRTVQSRSSEERAAQSQTSVQQKTASDQSKESKVCDTKASPDLTVAKIDWDALALEVKRRKSTSSESSSSSDTDSDSSDTSSDQDVLSLSGHSEVVKDKSVDDTPANQVARPDNFEWAHNLSDSSPDCSPKPQPPSTTSVTERKIAIRTVTQTEQQVIPEPTIEQRRFEELQEIARNQARLLQAYGLPANYLQPGHAGLTQHPAQYWPQLFAPPPPPPPPPAAPAPIIKVAPVIQVRVDNAGPRRRRKQDLTPAELKTYQAESEGMKRGAAKRFKQRILKGRQGGPNYKK